MARSKGGQQTHRAVGWTTRLPRAATRNYGCEELHAVVFQPVADRGGVRNGVAVQIPETPKPQIKTALKCATKAASRVLFVCDTGEQAVTIAAFAAPRLPKHRRVALERAVNGDWNIAGAT